MTETDKTSLVRTDETTGSLEGKRCDCCKELMPNGPVFDEGGLKACSDCIAYAGDCARPWANREIVEIGGYTVHLPTPEEREAQAAEFREIFPPDTRYQQMEQRIQQLETSLHLALIQPAPAITDRISELVHENLNQKQRIAELENNLAESQKHCQRYCNGELMYAERFHELLDATQDSRKRFQAMHRRAQEWERKARVWKNNKDGVEYWIKQWEGAYGMQSYYFEKYHDEREHNKALAIVIEMLRAELELRDKQSAVGGSGQKEGE